MNYKLAGVVVLYRPVSRVLQNIESYIKFLDTLFVVDNSEVPNLLLTEQIKAISKVVYVPNNSNLGVAAALNIGAELALNIGADWLLTMDQDSSFSESSLRSYMNALEFLNANNQIAVIGVSYANDSTGDLMSDSMNTVYSVITSGSLLRLRIWEFVGGFNANLFIDEVDHEFCYRVTDAGFQVMQLNHIHMNHEMGKSVSRGYAGLLNNRKRMIHPPLRVYYIVRNYLYVRKIFKSKFPFEFKSRDRQVLNILKNNLFFSGTFWSTFKMTWRGYRDFKHQKMGKFAGNLSK